jgi:hypothetical protein
MPYFADSAYLSTESESSDKPPPSVDSHDDLDPVTSGSEPEPAKDRVPINIYYT